MTLRKFGVEHGTVEVDEEAPQGISRTAMSHLAAAEAAPAVESTEEAAEAQEAPPAE